MLQRVQVRAADAAGQRADQHLAGSWSRVGDLVDDEFLVSHDGRAHGATVVAVTNVLTADDPGALDAAVAALTSGEPIVVPTDTVYGLAALPASTAAVDRLYQLKDRPSSVPIAVLVASSAQAEALLAPSRAVDAVARAFWPGPLTIVAVRRDRDETVGVRCPDHAFIRHLAERVGPLAVTSANRHGQPTPATAPEAAAGLAGTVALVIDGGPCEGQPSTVVDVSRDDIVMIREGTITEEQIRTAALR